MTTYIRLIAMALFTAGIPLAAEAGITNAVFDFENQSVTSNGGLTSLSLANQGLTISIDRAGEPFDVANLSAFGGTSAFGSRTLAPTPPGNTGFNVNFSHPASSFSAQLGDFGAGKTDSLSLTAFSGANGTGTNLGTTNASLVLTNAALLKFQTLAFSGTNIGSIQMAGGTTADANSVYYDNFHAQFASSSGGTGGSGNSVPLPPAAAVMPLGALVAWWGAKKLRISNL
jgi:hypothetical protein